MLHCTSTCIVPSLTRFALPCVPFILHPSSTFRGTVRATSPLGEEPNPGSPRRPSRPYTPPKRGSRGVPKWCPPLPPRMGAGGSQRTEIACPTIGTCRCAEAVTESAWRPVRGWLCYTRPATLGPGAGGWTPPRVSSCRRSPPGPLPDGTPPSSGRGMERVPLPCR